MNRKIMLIVLVTAALVAAGYWMKTNSRPLVNEKPLPEAAFILAQWGMSPKEVETANNTVLKPVNSYRRFYTPKQDIDKTRYQALEQSGLHFLGREASVIYTFIDEKLFGYHVFVSDRDPVAMDKDLRVHLASLYGNETSAVNDETPLKLIWDQANVIVNYWIYKDTVSVTQKYTAGFGVVSRKYKQSLGV